MNKSIMKKNQNEQIPNEKKQNEHIPNKKKPK